MVAANGKDILTIGVGDFTLSFNEKQFKLPAIVADINAEVILGLDFMQKFSCEIKMKDCTYIAEDVVINCFMKGKMGCYRIVAAETVNIPSSNEIIIPGNISEKDICLEKIGIIEP